MNSPQATQLTLSSDCIDNGSRCGTRYAGRGEDVSPELRLHGLDAPAETLAVTLEDLTHPLFGTVAHWVEWNILAGELIPEAIPPGRVSPGTEIVQGIAYGLHRYRGPKPPRGTTHTYRFTVYVLDDLLWLSGRNRLAGLKRAVAGHVLQQAELVGTFE